MIVIEKKDNILNIVRYLTNQSVGFSNNTSLEYIIINEYQSVDIDKQNNNIRFVINSNVMYDIFCRNAKSELTSILKSEFRDNKINQVLNES